MIAFLERRRDRRTHAVLAVLLAADEPLTPAAITQRAGLPLGSITPVLLRLETAGHLGWAWPSSTTCRSYKLTETGRVWAEQQMADAGPGERAVVGAGRVRALHRPVRCTCPECAGARAEGWDADVCGHCTTLRGPAGGECGVPWPCATVRALDGEEP